MVSRRTWSAYIRKQSLKDRACWASNHSQINIIPDGNIAIVLAAPEPEPASESKRKRKPGCGNFFLTLTFIGFNLVIH